MNHPLHALLPLALLSLALAQDPASKRPLTHDDYDSWKSLAGTTYTKDGSWLAVTYAAQEGDGVLVVRQTTGSTIYTQPRGREARFSADGKWVAFLIDPTKAETRKHKLEQLEKQRQREREGGGATGSSATPAPSPEPAAGGGRRGGGRRGGGQAGGAGPAPASAGAPAADEGPKAVFGLMNLADGKVETIQKVKGYRFPEEGPAVLLLHLEREEVKAESRPASSAESQPQTQSRASRPASRVTDPGTRRRQDGTPLVVRDLSAGKTTRIENVTSFGLPRKRAVAWFTVQTKTDDKEAAPGLFALDLASGKRTTLLAGIFEAKSFTYDKEETRLAFAANLDDWKSEKPLDCVYLWDFGAGPAQQIVSNKTPGFPAGRTVAAGGIAFARDGSRLLLGAGKLPEPDLPPVLADEKVTLDLWSWKDGLLQPMQEKRVGELRNRTMPCVWHCAEKRLQALGGEEVQAARFLTPDGTKVLAQNSDPYLQEMSWDASYEDVFVIDTKDGLRKRLVEHLRGNAQGSAMGRYIVWFDAGHWHSVDVTTLERKVLTKGMAVRFENEEWDQPSPAGAYGIAGWTKDDAGVLLQDRYDVWELRPATGEAICVTEGSGRAAKISYRPLRIDPEAEYFDAEQPLLLSGANEQTRATGFYVDSLRGNAPPKPLLAMDKAVAGLTKPKHASRYFFTIGSFAEFPDLWTTDLEFGDLRRLTDANPQQQQIRWGKAELVHWMSGDGVPLKGVLIKPEGFDPARKYPMIVHYYERLSQSLHSYTAPAPGTSPNASYYVSNGYLWFSPDIVYKVGYPGESCFKCVVPGVQSLIAQGFVDPKAIALSGHSWGGYQTAYLITRTNLFRAAEAGAPVANMTSAYGGIRWSTGMSRAFQYEQTQSRIGATLWEAQMRYLENSPLFFADKVTTPLLMLHNDQDGAVPWYQGIEYFTALRRLGKEVYLFNYNGEDHGLRRRANMKDWSRRMAEFFDHHLRGAPAPQWMAEGVSYVERDKEKLRYVKKAETAQPVEASASTGGK